MIRSTLILIAIMAMAFSVGRAVEASWSGSGSTCETTFKITGTPTGLSHSIHCGGTCYSSALGHGSCVYMKSGTAMYDHDNNPATDSIQIDIWTCGCKFENPMPEGGYIYVYDQLPDGQGGYVMECDGAGFVLAGDPGPDSNGTVVQSSCTGLCPSPPGGDCTPTTAPPQSIPVGQSYVSACSCQ